ncbi:hypothetical protein [Microbispora sp. CA-102843]|uniref:hypothetical protein n=1 Tax=Microbispora sp. CA-102843 TaxID=3239952 RepID=UPI003D94B433
MTDSNPRTRLTGVLLLTSFVAMIAGAAIVVPSGLTLNSADPDAVLVAVGEQFGLHLTELVFDVLGWLALTAAGLVMSARSAQAPRPHLVTLAGGLLAAAGLAGLLHDAGNLALTQLAADPTAPAVATVAWAVLLTAKWAVNLAGLLWVAATAAAVGVPMPTGLRIAGAVAAISGLAAVALPWTTGTDGPTVALEQLGYALHLPIMIWYGVLGWRYLRNR